MLWLALLLPVAQLAASWHTLSHIAPDAGHGANSKQALHTTHCDLCLTAATIAGGALITTAAAVADATARHALPAMASGSVWLAPPARAYRSRAPPFSSR